MPADPIVRQMLTAPGGLSFQLKHMRLDAGLSGARLGELSGLSTSKISRVENGVLWPSADDIASWAKACGQQHLTEELTQLMMSSRSSGGDWMTRLAGGHLAVSKAITSRLLNASRVVWWEVDVIPGMLQSTEYAYPIIVNAMTRHGLPTDDAWVSAQERNHQMLATTSEQRTVEVFIGEPALRWRYTTRDVHRSQLNRLLAMADRPTTTLGIVPIDCRLPDVLPNPFAMFDDHVLVEDITGERFIVHDTTQYRHATDMLRSVAITGEGAKALIRAAMFTMGERGTVETD